MAEWQSGECGSSRAGSGSGILKGSLARSLGVKGARSGQAGGWIGRAKDGGWFDGQGFAVRLLACWSARLLWQKPTKSVQTKKASTSDAEHRQYYDSWRRYLTMLSVLRMVWIGSAILIARQLIVGELFLCTYTGNRSLGSWAIGCKASN